MESNVLGREVARIRKSKGLTQEQLGRRVGLQKSSISKIENGHTRLTWEDAAILMEAMGEEMMLSKIEPESEANLEQKSQMLTSGIEWFADQNNLSLSEAYRYMLAFKGIDYLAQNYRYEQTLPKDTILSDIVSICRQNGGRL